MPEGTRACPEDFISFMEANDISFNKETGKGVVFHLLSAIEEYGKVGYTVIGHNPLTIRQISEKVIRLTNQFCSKKIKKPA